MKKFIRYLVSMSVVLALLVTQVNVVYADFGIVANQAINAAKALVNSEGTDASGNYSEIKGGFSASTKSTWIGYIADSGGGLVTNVVWIGAGAGDGGGESSGSLPAEAKYYVKSTMGGKAPTGSGNFSIAGLATAGNSASVDSGIESNETANRAYFEDNSSGSSAGGLSNAWVDIAGIWGESVANDWVSQGHLFVLEPVFWFDTWYKVYDTVWIDHGFYDTVVTEYGYYWKDDGEGGSTSYWDSKGIASSYEPYNDVSAGYLHGTLEASTRDENEQSYTIVGTVSGLSEGMAEFFEGLEPVTTPYEDIDTVTNRFNNHISGYTESKVTSHVYGSLFTIPTTGSRLAGIYEESLANLVFLDSDAGGITAPSGAIGSGGGSASDAGYGMMIITADADEVRTVTTTTGEIDVPLIKVDYGEYIPPVGSSDGFLYLFSGTGSSPVLGTAFDSVVNSRFQAMNSATGTDAYNLARRLESYVSTKSAIPSVVYAGTTYSLGVENNLQLKTSALVGDSESFKITAIVVR